MMSIALGAGEARDFQNNSVSAIMWSYIQPYYQQKSLKLYIWALRLIDQKKKIKIMWL